MNIVKQIVSLVGLLFVAVGMAFSQAPTSSPVLHNEDVVKMVKAGISPLIVISTIKTQPSAFTMSSDDMIKLKSSGIPDEIVAAMIAAGTTKGSAGKSNAGEITVPDGTEVKLRLLKPISSSTAHVEDRVDFEMTEDVVVNNVVIIKKGAAATGKVTEAQPKKSFGRQGKLNFTIDVVKAVDGQNIRLRSTKETKGAENYTKAGVVTILTGPFGALVQGKDIDLPAGTEYTIYIDGDRTIKLKD